MSCSITIGQLISVLQAAPVSRQLDRNSLAMGICTDTRSMKKGQVFVALRGSNFDGHNFVAAAIEKGAIAVIIDSRYPNPNPEWPFLTVPDTLKAYQAIARWWRDQFSIPIIAVTGSVGKTSTKELIAAVLSTQGKVLKTQRNYNNEIGVPKTLLELSSEHKFAVVEMAMRGTGQIAELTEIAKPTIGVIVNVGTAHIELLGSEDAIARAKCELLAEMESTSVAILNCDNQRLIDTAATVWQGQTLTYGLEGGDLRGELLDSSPELAGDRSSMPRPYTLKVEGVSLPVPLPGRHNALNYLAALSVAKVIGISWQPLEAGLSLELPDGRAKSYELANNIVILDETYNAGLESMTAALQLLAETPGQRKIAVLGTMKELGERSIEFHRQIGSIARDLKLDALFIFADPAEAEAIAAGAGSLPFVRSLPIDPDPQASSGHDKLAQQLQEFIEPGDRILFKASHSVELNRVVAKLRGF